jgi:hypothetical protein
LRTVKSHLFFLRSSKAPGRPLQSRLVRGYPWESTSESWGFSKGEYNPNKKTETNTNRDVTNMEDKTIWILHAFLVSTGMLPCDHVGLLLF